MGSEMCIRDRDNCAEVSCDRKVDDIDLKQAVERAGFEVLGISQV